MKPSTVLFFATPVIAAVGFGLADLAAKRQLAGWEGAEGSGVAAAPGSAFRSGLYTVSAGAKDWQSTHNEDEVYWVIRGRAVLRLEDRDLSVLPGSVVYVKAGEQHHFYDVEEDIAAMTFMTRESR